MSNIARAEAAYLREAQDLYEYQQRAISEVVINNAELQVLGDMDTFCDEVGSMAVNRRDGAEQSQRVARVVSRLDECDLDVLLGAALICAHQGDDEMALAAMKTLAARYLKMQASYIDKIVSEAA